jgi:uncharacterized protein YdaU (DUF1376 family)
MPRIKKNLPNIPLYIGDWEKDCNVLSLEAEAAWLRIIFKMFTNGKQSTYKIPTKGLQNLWRCGAEKVSEIIQELTDFDICEINNDGRFTEFTSRRFKRENEISETRSNAVKSRYSDTNDLQNVYKTSTKHLQTPEIEIENNIDNNSTVSISDKVKIKEEVNNKKKSAKNFEKPSVEEIAEYCRERNNSISPEAFFDFYESKGWKVGNQPMKDWKAAVRTWEKRSLKPTQQQPAPVKGVYESALEMNAKLNQMLDTPGMFDENGMLIGAKWNKKAE